jgi:hypothetical protein
MSEITVGQTVTFVISGTQMGSGTVTRVWQHGDNVTIVSGPGKTYVRKIDRVTPTRSNGAELAASLPGNLRELTGLPEAHEAVAKRQEVAGGIVYTRRLALELLSQWSLWMATGRAVDFPKWSGQATTILTEYITLTDEIVRDSNGDVW